MLVTWKSSFCQSEPNPCQHQTWVASKASIGTVVQRDTLVRRTEITTRKEERGQHLMRREITMMTICPLHHKDACRHHLPQT